jgi:hypothetical protein
MKSIFLFSLLIILGCNTINTNQWMRDVGKSYRKKDPFCNCPKNEQNSTQTEILTDSLSSFKITIDSSFVIDSSRNTFFKPRWLRIKNKKDSTSSLIIFMDSLYIKSDSVFFSNLQTNIQENDTIRWSGKASSGPLARRLPYQRENHGDYICMLTFKILSNNREYYFILQTSNPTKDTHPKNFHCNFQQIIESFTTF